MGSNKRKYLRNNPVRLLISYPTVSYGALNILLGTIQKERDTNTKNKIEKNNDMNEGVFRIQWNIYDGAFMIK